MSPWAPGPFAAVFSTQNVGNDEHLAQGRRFGWEWFDQPEREYPERR